MTDYGVFDFRLDLLLRLIDTTTGRTVTEQNCTILQNDRTVQVMSKEAGTYLFLNMGREDFMLTVRVHGYEEMCREIAYGALDPKLPAVDLHLIPSARSPVGLRCHTLEGQMEGLTEIVATRNGNSACHAKEFDQRKRILQVFNPHHLEMDHVHYALIHLEAECFESFEIIKRISDQEYKLKKPLEKEFESHYPISRLVFGMAHPDGRYVLRLPDDSKDAKWLVRLTVGSEMRFYAVDCNRPETVQLKEEVI